MWSTFSEAARSVLLGRQLSLTVGGNGDLSHFAYFRRLARELAPLPH